jgi:hypothetical protein
VTDESPPDGGPLPAAAVEAACLTGITDIPAVLQRMRMIQAALAEEPPGEDLESLRELHEMKDGLACFNHLYRVITAQILTELAAGEFFHDPTFLQELDVQFARRYFTAIATYGAGHCSSRSWAVLIDRRRDPAITPMQFAVAGVNTHVNFDLPFAVVATCQKLGHSLHTDQQKHDYDRVNEVFFTKIPALRRHFEDRWDRRLDRRIVRQINNHVDDMVVVLDRGLAWLQAEQLWRIRDSAAYPRAEQTHDASVALLNHALLAPRAPWI